MFGRCPILSLVVCLSAFAQMHPLSLEQSRYELTPGGQVQLPVSASDLEFLLSATSLTVVPLNNVPLNKAPLNNNGAAFTAGPNRAGNQIVLAASLRTPGGDYPATVTATSSTGEVRQAGLDIVVSPRITVPLNATRPPVVLLNGWETGYVNSCPVSTDSTETFGNLARYLTSDGVPVVYFFDNCKEDPNQPLETLGNDLAAFLQSITFDNGTPVTQIDVVAHSIGGLIVRSSLAGLQTNGTLTPPANTLIRKLVLIATPNFGSFVAENFASIINAGTQSAELIPGSAFLWNLSMWNQHVDDLRGVNAISVIGNAGTYTNNLSGAALDNASDGIVSLTSASMNFVAQNSTNTRIVPYCHVDPFAFTNLSLEPFNCNAPGIANVTSTSHFTGQIVRSFLSGTADWSSIGTTPANDVYLTGNGGTFFGMINGAGVQITDLTQVIWGTVQLQNGGATNTIFYNDFVAGTGDYQVTSSSLGTFDCGTVTEAIGYFASARCKIATAIISVGPLASTSPRLVNSGQNITITGAALGALCNGCKVVATPVGGTGVTLKVASWNASTIVAALPATLSGLVNIGVFATTGSDGINVMVASPAAPAIVVSPTTLSFTSVNGSIPATQTFQITNTGGGTLTWTATSSATWLTVSASSGTAPSTITVSINPAGLAVGTDNGTIQITASGATGSPVTVAVTLTVQGTQTAGGGTITGVVNSGSFAAGIAPATWASIFGSNLATTTYAWQSSDFVNGALPTTLQGVSVTIDGRPAYVEYVSPTQINVLAPTDSAIGQVAVQATLNQQTSNVVNAQLQQFAPAFFAGTGIVAAEHSDYTLISAASPAKPGEVVLLFGTGFGLTNPAVSTGQLFTTPEPLANQVQISIGGTTANVAFAGLIEPGLYQFDVTIPSGASGSAAVLATVNGLQSQTGVTIPVQQ
jgi:uncharacterized protein (TIGR03437 family)